VTLGDERGIRPPITLSEVRQAAAAIEDARGCPA